jgi:hypothetical protein
MHHPPKSLSSAGLKTSARGSRVKTRISASDDGVKLPQPGRAPDAGTTLVGAGSTGVSVSAVVIVAAVLSWAVLGACEN